MNTVIQTRGLEKRFGRVRALDGLDLDVEAGEVHGFLGPNGAGKSTTIRVLLGLIRSSGGSATVFGRDPWNDAVELHRRIAYVPGDVSLWPNLSGGEAIDLLTRLRGGMADKRAYLARREHLVEVFQFDPTKKGRAYSKGNRQKVALIAALATPADLYIFDEPTKGVDVGAKEEIYRLMVELAREGKSIVMISSDMPELLSMSDRIGIMRGGRMVRVVDNAGIDEQVLIKEFIGI